MSKGGGSQRTITTTSSAPAYAQPQLEFGVQEARRLYDAPTPQYFPRSTVVGFSPETETALSGYRQMATAGSPFIGATQDVVMQNLMGTNPLQQAAFQPVVERVQAEASKAGRYGSGYQQAALGQALAPYALQAQQAAIQQAPMARELGFADYQTLAQVGAAREAQAQAELEADIQRYNYEQTLPQQKLADFLTAVGGGTAGGQTMQPVYRNPAAGFLSGGLAGAQAAQMMGNPAYGGALMAGGALLGGFA